MTREEAAALERLLRLPDNDLLDLVMGKAQAPDAGLCHVLDKLRAA
jgi:succinate dehydrogenase flavin-adding protein (antitoxin of CptAB toxin-antitoxin module)